ncbi:MAG: PDZ domain-containing protein, partial [Pannonibacter indicus]
SPFAGATVLNLSPAVSDELRLDTMDEGVVISEVAQGSPANRVGLRPGDIIVGVNEQKVTTTAELDRMLRRPARFWLLDIKRGGETTRLALRG